MTRRPRRDDRERWNDYGIGLLLQGDLKGARAAFTKVTRIEPAYADGWVNLGRVTCRKATSTARDRADQRSMSIRRPAPTISWRSR